MPLVRLAAGIACLARQRDMKLAQRHRWRQYLTEQRGMTKENLKATGHWKAEGLGEVAPA
ncbi:MAG: hypothetical protein QJR11_02425 [Fulvimonas sp.]|jgi:cell division inhibitor SulA|nr:hypothetical protein [Fulvimonas sp.]